MATPYLERLAARSAAIGTVLCVGIDPDPDALPDGFPCDVHGIEAFARLIVERAGPFAAAIKPNLAFFEAFGSAGLAALERVRAAIPADIPVVMDAKRGDVGTTSGRHAAALYDALGADAITVSPYVGEEGLRPLLERQDRLAYVLCRTSNAGAEELQGLHVRAAGDGDAKDELEPLWAVVARRVEGWGLPGTVGLVVGATAPAELAAIRAIAPGLPFLVPGVGAQGGDAAAVLGAGRATAAPTGQRPGAGLLVNVSRGISGAAVAAGGGAGDSGGDAGDHLERAARDWAARLPVLL